MAAAILAAILTLYMVWWQPIPEHYTKLEQLEIVTEGLLRREEVDVSHSADIQWEYGRACEAEHIVFLEALHDCRVHITKLAAVALIKYNHDLTAVDFVILILLDEG